MQNGGEKNPTCYARKWPIEQHQHQPKAFFSISCAFGNFGSNFADWRRTISWLQQPLEDSAGPEMLAWLQSSSLPWTGFRKEGNGPFYPSHYLTWDQNLKAGWKDSWHTEEEHPDGSPLSFGWQGALSKDFPAAPVAQEEMKSNRQSWPFPILILTPVPLEQTLDYFQHKASGSTPPVQTLK